jgi:hypothetical protein
VTFKTALLALFAAAAIIAAAIVIVPSSTFKTSDAIDFRIHTR